MPEKIVEERREEFDPDIKVDPRLEPRDREPVPVKRTTYSRTVREGREDALVNRYG